MAKYLANATIRIDVFLARETGLTRSNIKTVIENDGVLINGVMRKKSGFEVKAVIKLTLPCPNPKPLTLSRIAILNLT